MKIEPTLSDKTKNLMALCFSAGLPGHVLIELTASAFTDGVECGLAAVKKLADESFEPDS